MAELGKEYTDELSSEGLIRYIANDYNELSHDKIVAQRDYYRRICQRWLRHNGVKDANPGALESLESSVKDFQDF